MIKCETKFRYYACAMGQHRSRRLSGEDKGSLFVEDGYVGMSQWLAMITPARRGAEIQQAYPDAMIILVYDGIVDDLVHDFRNAHTHVRRELNYAGLSFASMSYISLLDKIRSEETHIIKPMRF